MTEDNPAPGTALLLAAAPAGKGRLVDAASVLPSLAAVPAEVLTGSAGAPAPAAATVVELADPLDPQTVLTRIRAAAAAPGPFFLYLAGQLHLDRKQRRLHFALARSTPATLRYTALPWHWLAAELGPRPPGSTTVVADLVADAEALRQVREGATALGPSVLQYGRVVPAAGRRNLAEPAYLRAMAEIWRSGARPAPAELHAAALSRTEPADGAVLFPSSLPPSTGPVPAPYAPHTAPPTAAHAAPPAPSPPAPAAVVPPGPARQPSPRPPAPDAPSPVFRPRAVPPAAPAEAPPAPAEGAATEQTPAVPVPAAAGPTPTAPAAPAVTEQARAGAAAAEPPPAAPVVAEPAPAPALQAAPLAAAPPLPAAPPPTAHRRRPVRGATAEDGSGSAPGVPSRAGAADPHPAILDAARAGRHTEAAAAAAACEGEALRTHGPASAEALHWLEVRADLARLAGDAARSCELWMAVADGRLRRQQTTDDPDVEGAVDRAHHQWEQIRDAGRARRLAPPLVQLRRRVPGRQRGALKLLQHRLEQLQHAG
ncbi:hypothetical protein IAG43_31425 [Streptomyces genisteinicus]|uniref:Uncharacterized protein n=1 Tax=Streptomyces genisteinicus TaxID=2768068 RepID=A0A7H0I4I6_9ACTN|nr:hypothetical protein IAG43_31425 [Streptomyces genisteinicus]